MAEIAALEIGARHQLPQRRGSQGEKRLRGRPAHSLDEDPHREPFQQADPPPDPERGQQLAAVEGGAGEPLRNFGMVGIFAAALTLASLWIAPRIKPMA